MDRLYCSSVFTLSVFLFQFVEVNSIFASEWPVSRSVFENNDVEFFCEVRDKQDTEHLVWFSDMDDSDTIVRLEFANETTDLEYDNNGGQHSIEYELTSSNTHRLTYRIKGAKVADEGLYACGYIPLPIPQSVSRNNVLGDYANLQVLVPPTESKPKCTTNTAVITSITDKDNILGMPLDLSCQITGGRPEPELTWHRNNDSITSGKIGVNQITHVLEAADNGVEFSCVASGNSLQEDGSCSFIPLQILPTATVSTTSSHLSHGDNVTLTCVGDGLPFVSGFGWIINGASLQDLEDFEYFINQTESSSELMILDAHFNSKHNEISCIVRVPSGLTSSSTITVSYVTETQFVFTVLFLIIATSSGLLLTILIISIIICLCKRNKKKSIFGEDINHGNDSFDEYAHSNPYQENGDSAEGYVINEIGPGVPRGATMGSDHPYATVQRGDALYSIMNRID